MPLYEYVCEQDDSVIELIRPSAQADAPVDDPKGLGRQFKRRFSTFSAKAGESTGTNLPLAGCPCGNPQGGCRMG